MTPKNLGIVFATTLAATNVATAQLSDKEQFVQQMVAAARPYVNADTQYIDVHALVTNFANRFLGSDYDPQIEGLSKDELKAMLEKRTTIGTFMDLLTDLGYSEAEASDLLFKPTTVTSQEIVLSTVGESNFDAIEFAEKEEASLNIDQLTEIMSRFYDQHGDNGKIIRSMLHAASSGDNSKIYYASEKDFTPPPQN